MIGRSIAVLCRGLLFCPERAICIHLGPRMQLVFKRVFPVQIIIFWGVHISSRVSNKPIARSLVLAAASAPVYSPALIR